MTKPNDTTSPTIEVLSEVAYISGGLTKREYFAAMALQGLISKNTPKNKIECSYLVNDAVMYADLLIDELNK